ncbi:RNA polymerase sigma factor [Flagellimonas olearia]|uniref:RNA polymerase sigma-70 factor n=1 Tax=Flagellimonas olearia TaxID=552546 RepID=A0A444VI30_9FLAO|nr:sigma-70 family RNA polymerase sigma factor [Allomuricauda olearia]RYC50426.1 hypothetical protein DN53_05780 [Allomuricauda olearia]
MKTFENDNLLAKAIIDGDNQAFKLFFDTYNRPLLGYLLTLTQDRDLAEDIVQMSFVSIWKRRKSLQPFGFKQLLFTTAKNQFIDQYRSTVTRANLYAELTFDAVYDEEEDKEHIQQQIIKLRKIIETLPERCQQILRMTKLEGLSQQEAADYLGISIRTVEAQVRVAYTKIREAFDGDDAMILFLLMGALYQLYVEQDNS